MSPCLEKSAEHIYIHIPFCENICYYCDFPTHVGKLHWQEQYFEALEIEIFLRLKEEELYFDSLSQPLQKIKSVYFGGGTPSLVQSYYIRSCLEILQRYRKFSDDCEITIELNPESTHLFKLEDYKKMGINRLSIGFQTCNESLLKKMGRRHTVEDVRCLLAQARHLGFDNISFDFMLALPEQSLQDIDKSLQLIHSWHVPHISAYSLIIEEKTYFWHLYGPQGRKTELLPSENLERKQMHRMQQCLLDYGYEHYEISNFAKPGYHSRHNLAYWEAKEYHGFGAGASRYLRGLRSGSPSSLKAYCEAYLSQKHKLTTSWQEIMENQPFFSSLLPFLGKETSGQEWVLLNRLEQQKEFFLLGFRSLRGVSECKFQYRFSESFPLWAKQILKKLQEEKLVECLIIAEEKKWRLTMKGLDYANIVFAAFQ